MKPHQDGNNGAADAHQHRVERRRRRAPGDLQALRRVVWHALRRVGETLDDPTIPIADLCKAANALSALANAYRGATELGDLAARIEALERDRGVS